MQKVMRCMMRQKNTSSEHLRGKTGCSIFACSMYYEGSCEKSYCHKQTKSHESYMWNSKNNIACCRYMQLLWLMYIRPAAWLCCLRGNGSSGFLGLPKKKEKQEERGMPIPAAHVIPAERERRKSSVAACEEMAWPEIPWPTTSLLTCPLCLAEALTSVRNLKRKWNEEMKNAHGAGVMWRMAVAAAAAQKAMKCRKSNYNPAQNNEGLFLLTASPLQLETRSWHENQWQLYLPHYCDSSCMKIYLRHFSVLTVIHWHGEIQWEAESTCLRGLRMG